MKKIGRISKSPVFWGLVLILAAVAIVLEALDVSIANMVSPVRIALGVVILAWMISEIVRLKIANIFFPLAFLFILFEDLIATKVFDRADPNLINNWIVLAAALLLTIGFSILFSKQGPVQVSGNVGNHSLYFNAETELADAHVSDNLGQTGVYITNVAAYPGNGRITVSDNLGQITLHLPKAWRIVLEKHDNLGQVNLPPQTTESDQTLTLVVRDNVGQVSVLFN